MKKLAIFGFVSVLFSCTLQISSPPDHYGDFSVKGKGASKQKSTSTINKTNFNLAEIPQDALLPDIVEEPPRHLNVQRSQKTEFLRFSSTHWNQGRGPLQIRGGGQTAPCQVQEDDQIINTICTYSKQELLNAAGEVVFQSNAGVALFHPAHNHWHQDNVADFNIHRGTVDGEIVGHATKQTYCLIDFDHWGGLENNSGKVYYECNADLQGISYGYGDEYHHSTPGQAIEITNIPPGIYYLTHMADPANKWIEADDTNNFSWTKFKLTRDNQSGNASVKVLGESPCSGMSCGNTSNK
jgi:hypothetical protein